MKPQDIEELEEDFTTRLVSVNKLKNYEFNYKIHDNEQINKIALSIKENGWTQPIVIDKNDVVVIGHGRLFAAKRLGLKRVPCVVKDNLDDSQIKKLRVTDNELNSKTGYDSGLREMAMEEIPDVSDFISDYALEFEEYSNEVEKEVRSVDDSIELPEDLNTETITESSQNYEKEDDNEDDFDFLDEPEEESEKPNKKEKAYLVQAFCSSFDEQLEILNYFRSKGIKAVAK